MSWLTVPSPDYRSAPFLTVRPSSPCGGQRLHLTDSKIHGLIMCTIRRLSPPNMAIMETLLGAERSDRSRDDACYCHPACGLDPSVRQPALQKTGKNILIDTARSPSCSAPLPAQRSPMLPSTSNYPCRYNSSRHFRPI